MEYIALYSLYPEHISFVITLSFSKYVYKSDVLRTVFEYNSQLFLCIVLFIYYIAFLSHK